MLFVSKKNILFNSRLQPFDWTPNQRLLDSEVGRMRLKYARHLVSKPCQISSRSTFASKTLQTSKKQKQIKRQSYQTRKSTFSTKTIPTQPTGFVQSAKENALSPIKSEKGLQSTGYFPCSSASSIKPEASSRGFNLSTVQPKSSEIPNCSTPKPVPQSSLNFRPPDYSFEIGFDSD